MALAITAPAAFMTIYTRPTNNSLRRDLPFRARKALSYIIVLVLVESGYDTLLIDFLDSRNLYFLHS